MNWWFIGIILWLVLELGGTIAKHGEDRRGKYNFGASLVVIGALVTVIYMAIKTGF